MDWICENGGLIENQLNNLKINGDFAELSENVGEGYLETPVIENEELTRTVRLSFL